MTNKAQQPSTQISAQAYKLYDKYAHGMLSRRDFFAAMAGLAVNAVLATTFINSMLPNYALAQQVSFNDADIIASYQKFASPQGHGEGRGYLVKPKNASAALPAVLVIHENRGLNPYIEDVARRLAKAGFIAFAPDALWPLGGYPGNDDDGRDMQRSLEPAKIVADLKAAAQWLKQLEGSSGKLGVVGFCFGGAMTGRLAAELPDIVDAGVPFYGSPPPADSIGNIKAPLLVQLGELDERVNAMWPAAEALFKQHKLDYKIEMYPASHHGFHNDSTARYNKEMAELAWQRTLAFFRQHLG
ncbi:dienelactone hydrolase family protein [Rheinheimera sp. YQF-2]|uniref:Dienelactone hydrolase family protein n=1 Tax=Rheinheimera lutimaris TaxID=2740584 RepID=A0A7Y5AQK4_9GAMM|nr:dienelactone hydrolase family protein [Rheinheimera lutimaris]NRQ42731.1 dienelactone hydrolase family protein [Rheinheimera lutimaris]